YYAPAHMETILRRAVARHISPGKMMFLLIWFWGCVTLERVHPLQGGFLRRKVRTDRRPGLPIENPFVFQAKRVTDTLVTYAKVAGMVWRLHRLRGKLKRDPQARNYMDQALMPVADSDLDTLEMLNVSKSARAAGDKARRDAARAAARASAV